MRLSFPSAEVSFSSLLFASTRSYHPAATTVVVVVHYSDKQTPSQTFPLVAEEEELFSTKTKVTYILQLIGTSYLFEKIKKKNTLENKIYLLILIDQQYTGLKFNSVTCEILGSCIKYIFDILIFQKASPFIFSSFLHTLKSEQMFENEYLKDYHV